MTTTITRSALYARIWEQPLRTVAHDLGLSDSGLAKICRKHNIPRPPRGYWAKRHHGHHVTQIKLPPDQSGADPNIRIDPESHRAATRQAAIPLEIPIPDVQVPERITHSHPIVAEFRRLLSKARADDYGRLWSHPRVPLKVSRQSLGRALRILDTLLKAAIKQGYAVNYDDDRGELVATVDGERLKLSIEEPAQRFPVPPPENPPSYWSQQYRYEPTGRLAVKLEGCWLRGVRRHWQDGARQRLETQLGHVLATLQVAANLLKTQRAEEAIREAQRQIMRRRRARQRRRHELLQARGRQLQAEAASWEAARQLRAYLAALAASGGGHTAQQQRLARWGQTYADHLDPLVPFRRDDLDREPAREATDWLLGSD